MLRTAWGMCRLLASLQRYQTSEAYAKEIVASKAPMLFYEAYLQTMSVRKSKGL